MKRKNKDDKSEAEKQAAAPKSRLRENIEAIIIAVILALFIRTFIIQAFKIPSGSMLPTLQIGDHILVNKFIYGVKLPYLNTNLIPVGEPERDAIIVFRYPEEPDKDFIKRVIAVPGDVLEIRNKKVFVNHEPLEHPYAVYTDTHVIPAQVNPRDNLGPITVPPDSYFVMGDNRDNSYDSRFWGFVDASEIRGKAFIIYWSWDSNQFGVRWNRIGSLIK
ncbi:MAG: signal peptidase I [Desulfobacteraceae bacterium]|nr:MAG: signal peptidase I [Desulfobacteraceae bacterium]